MFVQNYYECFLTIILKKIIGEYSFHLVILKLRFGLSKDKYEHESNFALLQDSWRKEI